MKAPSYWSATAFSPNGRSLLSASDDYTVRLWNLRDGSSKRIPAPGTSTSFCVAFRPVGRYIAGGDTTHCSIWIWDSRSQKLVAQWPAHPSAVWSIEFTPDGKGLISGGGDGIVKYWDVTSIGSGSHWKSFPVIRRFSGYNVRLFCLLSITS